MTTRRPLFRVQSDGGDCVVLFDLYDREADAEAIPVGVGACPLEAFLDARATLAAAIREVEDALIELVAARVRRAGADFVKGGE